MKPYSMDLRQRVAAARDGGMETAEVAQVFGCCASWVRRLMQHQRERGTLEPQVRRQPDQRGLDDDDRQRLRQLVEQRPDATLAELLAAMEKKVHPGTLSRTLKIMGLSRKKDAACQRARSAGRQGETRRDTTTGSCASGAASVPPYRPSTGVRRKTPTRCRPTSTSA